MSHPGQFGSGKPTGRRRVELLVAGTLLTGALAATWVARSHPATPTGPWSWIHALAGRSGERAFGLAAESPYTNVRPGREVRGRRRLRACHAEISETYRRHPMGRSLGRCPLRDDPGPGCPDRRPLFQAQGLEYSVERRGDRVFHKEIKRDAGGRIVARNEAEVRYVIGSGEQAMAFLVERGDGYLFESPITWYSRKRRWDLSPGYERDNDHFERPVKPACLFCHANRVEHVEGTENRYRQPIFRGHAIGCERCHGPGELHVRQPRARRRPSRRTSSTPPSLEPALREAVCQQCHLQGDVRVVRAGRTLADFRPGLPLHVHRVGVREGRRRGGKTRFFGQVEQMHESRCFRESQGRLGCISCHDPHRLPEPAEKAAYYRERCLECHAEKGLQPAAGPSGWRRSRGRQLHRVPHAASPNEQVPHTATTLHLIPRFKDRPGAEDGRGHRRPRGAYRWSISIATRSMRASAPRSHGTSASPWSR